MAPSNETKLAGIRNLEWQPRVAEEDPFLHIALVKMQLADMVENTFTTKILTEVA